MLIRAKIACQEEEMEPTTTQRLLHGHQDAEETQATVTTRFNGSNVPLSSRSRVPDSNLAQWKQGRLAHHHAYHTLLLKAFGRWKQVTELRQQRRQRVIAACRVGAKFFERIYWNQWKEIVEHRRKARANAVERLQHVQERVRLQHCLRRWRLLVVGRQRAQTRGEPKAVSVGRLVSEQRLEVRGVRIQGDTLTNLEREASRPEAPASATTTSATAGVSHDLQHQREKKLRHIVIYRTQRQYFQVWRQAATTLQRFIAKKLRAQAADEFRVQSAWRRWRSGFLARSEYESASRRAGFFLYYQLTKSSLHRLRTHAERQRRERGVSVIIEKRVRRRTLAAVVELWRQRLDTKLVFTQWREAVANDNPHEPTPQDLRTVRDAVSRLSKERLLRQFFSVWLGASARKQKVRALAKVLKGPMLQILIRDGFEIWRQQTTTQRRVEELIIRRSRMQVTSAWRAWLEVTTVKREREQQRRRAARFWYYRTLRKSFSALQGLGKRRGELQLAADGIVESRKRRQALSTFLQWRNWSSTRSRRRQQLEQAAEHHALSIARLVFSALRENVVQAKSRQDAARQLAEKTAHHEVRRIFEAWKALYENERARNENLSAQLASYHAARSLRVKCDCFQALDEHARSRATRRLVNAHARGHHQSKLLRRVFTAWTSAVAQLKWEHIFNRRAQQFRDQRRKIKCFLLWKVHTHALQRHRQQTKLALHHWKKVREKAAFDAWKQYVVAKRRQSERMHAALEFRDRARIRDGLAHWITGATYLADQRSRRTVEMQVTHTARVWGKVRDVALHWLWLTQKRKLCDAAREVIDRGNVAFEERGDDERITHQRGHRRLPPPAPVQTRSMRRAVNPSDHPVRAEDHQSALSEFVVLPRNRPRPRKPIELILDSGESIEGGTHISETVTETLHSLNTRYGFHFPTNPPAATAHVETTQTMRESSDKGSYLVDEESREEIINYNGWTIDELEKRLLYWHDRRQRLKTLQQSLGDFRFLLQQASNEGNVPAQDLEHMKARLNAMEQQEAVSRRQWNDSRREIQTLAERIKMLKMTAVPA